MPASGSFSRRNRHRGAAKEITVREDAPESVRVTVVNSVRDLGWKPSALREVVCRVLRVRPDPRICNDYPDIWGDVEELLYGCEWFKVYDIIEALHARFTQYDSARRWDGSVKYTDEIDDRPFDQYEFSRQWNDAVKFADEVNDCFFEEGIGWKLVGGQIVSRSAEAFESTVANAARALEDSMRPTAASHVKYALQALSRRPDADCAGAIYHVLGALESIARDVSGDANATLGELVKRRAIPLPKPLDTALSKIWGYASNEARHVREGHDPGREEAELIVGLAAAMATYLTRHVADN